MEIVALELIKHLQQLDKENEYLIFVKDDVDEKCVPETDNFKLVKIPATTFADWEQIALPRAIKNYGLDALHCTCNTGPYFTNSPTVITLHDIIYLESLNFTGSAYQNIGNLYRRMVVPKVVPRCKSIITVSNFEKEKIVSQFNLEEDRVKVIYNGVSSRFKLNKDKEYLRSLLDDFNLPEKFILFFGNTAPKKNTRGVLKAYSIYAKENRHALPLVITDISEKFLMQELSAIGEEQAASNIRLLGYFPNKNMPSLYNLAELTLYPSLRESFGLPIIESMASGTPVITSNVSSMPEVAGDAALLVNPLNPEEIAAGIHTVLSDENLYNSMVRKGLMRAAAFSWESTAKSTLELYKCIAAEGVLV